MKKTVISFMMASMCILAVSCGNQSGNKNKAKDAADSKAVKELTKEIKESAKDGGVVGYTGDAGAALKTMDPSNYISVVKGIFGVDVTPQESWTVYTAKSPNKVNNANIIFTNEGEVDSAPVRKSFIDQILSVTEDGVCVLNMDYNTLKITKGEKIESFEDLKAKASGKTIYYVYGGKGIQAAVHVNSSAKKSVIEYTFGLVTIK